MAMSRRDRPSAKRPKAAFFSPIPLPKNCTGTQVFKKHPAANLLETAVGVSGVKCMGREGIPKQGVSQSDDSLYSPFQSHVWMFPGGGLCSLTGTWYNIGQHRKGFQAVPRSCDTNLSSSCGHIEVSFSTFTSDIHFLLIFHGTFLDASAFCRMFSSPQRAHRLPLLSHTLTDDSQQPGINSSIPAGFDGDRLFPKEPAPSRHQSYSNVIFT